MRKIFATFYQGIEKNKEWDKTRDIDNPLTPWTMLYQVDLNLPPPKTHHERPSVEMSVVSLSHQQQIFLFSVASHFSRPKQIAYWGAGGLTILMILIWPLLMLEAIKLDETR